jgi:uncharacterized protein YegP (UPF0339 family)
MKRPYRITVYDAKDGWRWRMTAPNNRIVAESGEAYVRKSSALRAAESMCACMAVRAVLVEVAG